MDRLWPNRATITKEKPCKKADESLLSAGRMNFDDLKVGFASVTGLGNWMLEIDILLKAAISLATLIYIVLKIREQLRKD